jgi:hypothetical protein
MRYRDISKGEGGQGGRSDTHDVRCSVSMGRNGRSRFDDRFRLPWCLMIPLCWLIPEINTVVGNQRTFLFHAGILLSQY